MADKFVIRKSGNGEYRAHFEHNQEKIFWTEGYSSKSGAQNEIDSVKKNGPDADVDDETPGVQSLGNVTPFCPIYLPARSA